MLLIKLIGRDEPYEDLCFKTHKKINTKKITIWSIHKIVILQNVNQN